MKFKSVELFEWYGGTARPITFLVRAVPEDTPPFHARPLYVASFRSGTYTWTTDPLYAHQYTHRNAAAHARALLEREAI